MAEAQILNFTQTFTAVGPCGECGVMLIMPSHYDEARRSDHRYFYCLNGHARHFPSRSTEEMLRAELVEKERLLAAERERASTNYAAREKAERENRKLKQRASGGACPCCKRSFVALGRHMKTKHPDFVRT
jgi:ssDNA-binding Zn-finger/Zn-ribbon topoisomerase 1